MNEIQSLLRAALETAADGIIAVNPAGAVIHCNRRFAELWSLSAPLLDAAEEPVIRQAMASCVKDPESFVAATQRAHNSTEIIACEVVELLDGRILERVGRPVVSEGRNLGWVWTYRDVTERRQASEALQREEQRFRLLLEGVRDYAIFMLDTSGAVRSWNPGATRILGYRGEEMTGRGLQAFFVPEDVDAHLPWKILWEAMAHDRSEQERWCLRGDGSRIWANMVTAAIRDGGGRLCGFSMVLRDVTEQKNAHLLEADRRAALELIARSQPLEQTLTLLVTMLQRQFPQAMALAMLLTDGSLAHVAPGASEGFLAALNAGAIRLAAGLRDLDSSRGGPLVVSDVHADAVWADLRPLLAGMGHEKCWSTMILSSENDPLGMFLVFIPDARTPGPADLQVCATVNSLAAIAVEHHQLSQRLAHQAQHDLLTGLPNRVLFEDFLRRALPRAQRNAECCAVVYADLDRFKYVNDTLGHTAGDQLLQQVAMRWRTCVREADVLCRMGGDEFAIVLPGLTRPQDAVQVARRMLAAMEQPCQVLDNEVFVSASIGIAVFPEDGLDGGDLQRNADVAMYRAKHMGRNNFQFFVAEMNAAAMERLELEGQLRRAIEGGSLELHYQPLVSGAGMIHGLEALARWNHPKLGMISPAKFVKLAEETGLIIPMGAWILREACRQAKAWQSAGLAPVKVAVNVSALQFAQVDFPQTVSSALLDTGLDPEWLELELTESLLMQNTKDGLGKLDRIKELGVSLAVDDFGTGYSSLAYLQRLPIDTLKIDRSFIREIAPTAASDLNGSDTAVIRAITSLAHSLGLKVLAEGVETRHQLEFLMRIGCDWMQGYLFSKPVPAEQVAGMLREHNVSLLPPQSAAA